MRERQPLAQSPASANGAPGGKSRAWWDDLSWVKALIFDVDGTLYQQGGVRRVMLYRLLRAHLTDPRLGYSTLRALRAYRKAQEMLRATSSPDGRDLAEAQLRVACERTGIETEMMAASVARWMEQEPLDLLAGHLRGGGLELLCAAREKGLRLGVFSDYPARPKLAAMGIEKFFHAVVSAQDPAVQKFKPDPRGLLVTLHRLGVGQHEALYICDRLGVDDAAAARAGMRCIIVGGQRDNDSSKRSRTLKINFPQLTKLLCQKM